MIQNLLSVFLHQKKNVLVDSFIKWKISDVEQYYVSVAGDEQRARIRLIQTVNDSLRAEFGKRTINDVISGERDQIMDLMRSRVDDDAQKIGVEVLDVRLKESILLLRLVKPYIGGWKQKEKSC